MSDSQATENTPLENAVFLQNLAPDERETLLQAGERITVESGHELFTLGNALDRLYLIESGEVALTLKMEIRGEDKEITLETKGPGSLIGWSALVRPHHSTLGARATSEARLMALGREALEQVFAEHPRIQQVTQVNISEIIASRLRTFEALLIHDLQQWAAKIT